MSNTFDTFRLVLILLSGALVVAGALCYAKGAVEGLREDEAEGRPVVVKNGTMVAGKVLITIGVAGIIFACLMLFTGAL